MLAIEPRMSGATSAMLAAELAKALIRLKSVASVTSEIGRPPGPFDQGPMLRVSTVKGRTIEIYIEDEETVWMRDGSSDYFQEVILDQQVTPSEFAKSIVR